MKTEMVAKWVVVEGCLELQWSIKDDNRVKREIVSSFNFRKQLEGLVNAA